MRDARPVTTGRALLIYTNRGEHARVVRLERSLYRRDPFVVNLLVKQSCCERALQHAPTLSSYLALHGMLEDIRMPIFSDKSDNQAGLDLLQPLLNRQVERWMRVMQWKPQVKLRTLLGTGVHEKESVDFAEYVDARRVVATEVQLGNRGRVHADLHKLKRLHEAGVLALGVIVCFDTKTGSKADKSLASFEQYEQALHTVGDVPIVLIGLTREGSETVDLRQVRDILLPQVLGGKGCPIVSEYVAEKLVDAVEPQDIVFPEHVRRANQDFNKRYVIARNAAQKSLYERLCAGTDPEHRTELLGLFAHGCLDVQEAYEQCLRTAPTASRAGAARKPPRKTLTVTRELPLVQRIEAPSEHAEGVIDVPAGAAPALPVEPARLVVQPERTGARRVRREDVVKPAPACEAPSLAQRLLAAKGPQTFAMHEALKKAALRAH